MDTEWEPDLGYMLQDNKGPWQNVEGHPASRKYQNKVWAELFLYTTWSNIAKALRQFSGGKMVYTEMMLESLEIHMPKGEFGFVPQNGF